MRRGGIPKGERRDLKGQPLPDDFVCTHCKVGACNKCSDVMRVVYELPSICKCKLPKHSGEPRDKQVMDPETETVYAPGLSVTKEGEVHRD